MRAERVKTPHEFLSRTEPLWRGREGQNCILLRWACSSVAGDPEKPSALTGTTFWTVSSEGALTLAATVRDGQFVALGCGPPEAGTALAEGLINAGTRLGRVFGPEQVSAAFAGACAGLTGGTATQTSRYRAYDLTEVISPRAAPGHTRLAEEPEAERLTGWNRAFVAEVVPPQPFDESFMRSMIVKRRVHVWCDPEPASMAAYVGYTPTGVLIGKVYTPPKCRGRGYASALVAEISRRALQDGRRFCCLLTEPDNPHLHRLYTGIGYRATLCYAGFALG